MLQRRWQPSFGRNFVAPQLLFTKRSSKSSSTICRQPCVPCRFMKSSTPRSYAMASTPSFSTITFDWWQPWNRLQTFTYYVAGLRRDIMDGHWRPKSRFTTFSLNIKARNYREELHIREIICQPLALFASEELYCTATKSNGGVLSFHYLFMFFSSPFAREEPLKAEEPYHFWNFTIKMGSEVND